LRLLSKQSIERITKILLDELENVRENEQIRNIINSWKPLPSPEKSSIYAVDGSRSVSRLSGTVIYFLSALAVGSGKQLRLSYANAIKYNYGTSDQIVRMQMETLENMLGYLAYRKLEGEKRAILMDGTLTGSLVRPPVYPEDIRSLNVMRALIGESDFENLLNEFLEKLRDHYRKVEEHLEKNGNYDSPILTDNVVEKLRKKYIDTKVIAYGSGKVKVKIPRKALGYSPRVIPIEVLESSRGKSVDELLQELDEEKVELYLGKDDIYDALHMTLSYIEYLYSIDKLLEVKNLAYIAKSFYTKTLARTLGVEIVDTALLDAVIRTLIGHEKEGYLEIEHAVVPPKWSFPDFLLSKFRNIEKLIDKGIHLAYVRFEQGDVIYMLQSTTNIEKILPLILHHKAGGYLRPLQLAHHGVKISYKEARHTLEALINALRNRDPALKIFVKYGRSPLE